MFSRLYNFPAILAVIIFPLLFLCLLCGWKDFCSSFSVIFKKDIDKKLLFKANNLFKHYYKIIFSMGFIAILIIVSAMVMALESQEYLGRMIIFSLAPLLYAAIVNMVIIIPYRIIINKKLIELED